MANLDVGGLNPDRPVKTGAVYSPPVIAVEGNFLIYGDALRRAKRNVSQGLLRGLLDARESSEKTIKFCRRWGVLGLCDHGLPFSHHEKCMHPPAFRTVVETVEIIHPTPVKHLQLEYADVSHAHFRESIDSVRRFAGALYSLLQIGAEMAKGNAGQADDWDNARDVITGKAPNPWPESPANSTVGGARPYLQVLIRELIQICRIRPRFWWNDKAGHDGSWQIDLDSEGSPISNLPALIVLELLVVIADKDGFAICCNCHRSYIPDRRPDPTRRNYCKPCGRKVAVRDALRDLRARERERKQKEKGAKEYEHVKAQR